MNTVAPTRDQPAGGPVNDPARPWLALRDNETLLEWHQRTSRSCWRCGHYYESTKLLDRHERTHETRGPRPRAEGAP